MLRKFLDKLTNTRRPAAGVPVRSAAEVREALLSINRQSAPFAIRDGGEDGVSLVAEWKILDANWREVFSSAGLKDVFRILLELHPQSREVRALDVRYTLSWQAGIPTLSLSAAGSRGQQWSWSAGTGHTFTEELGAGRAYSYRFRTGEIRQPVQEAVLAAGWTYRGVLSKRSLFR